VTQENAEYAYDYVLNLDFSFLHNFIKGCLHWQPLAAMVTSQMAVLSIKCCSEVKSFTWSFTWCGRIRVSSDPMRPWGLAD